MKRYFYFIFICVVFSACEKKVSQSPVTPVAPVPGINGPVSALTFYNGNLIAGGSFSQAGITSANNIVQWNGSTWSAL